MLVRAFAVLAVLLASATASFAHSWYSDKTDPAYKTPCCGEKDCSMWAIRPGELTAEAAGLRVRLTLERAREINPVTIHPVDALVIWDRVQPSEDGNWHLCIMDTYRLDDRGGIYCLFAPPNG